MRHGHLRQSRQGGSASGAPQDAVALRRVEVTRTFLALDAPGQLRPANIMTAFPVRLVRVSPCPVPQYRALYQAVGAEWHWRDRNAWTDAQLAEHLASPDVAIWVASATRNGQPGGYFELQRHTDGSVEIVYFGLVRSFIGNGIGGYMLQRAAEEAWAMSATRVWVHTCTLDSPNALPNYLKRGFVPYKTERFTQEID